VEQRDLTGSITVGVLLVLTGLGMAQNEPASPIPKAPVQTNQETATPLQPANPQADVDRLSTAVDRLTAEVTAWREQESQKTKSNESPSWPTISSTIVAAIATVFIALLGFFQYRVLHRQRLAMEKQSEYMREGLTLTKQAAEAASVSANSAKQSADIAGASLEAIREQTALAKLSAESAANNAAAAKTTAETMIRTERAWLLLNFKTNTYGLPHRVDITFRNSGRSPAFLIEVRFDFLSSPIAVMGAVNYNASPGFRLTVDQIIPPNDESAVFTRKVNRSGYLSEDDSKAIAAGATYLYVLGIVRYRDFSGDHETRFCYQWFPMEDSAGGTWAMVGNADINKFT
jgi:hypothetical protein